MTKNTKQLKNTLASWLVLTRENRAELVSKCLMVTFDYPFRGGLNAQIKSSQAPVANEFAFVSLEFLAILEQLARYFEGQKFKPVGRHLDEHFEKAFIIDALGTTVKFDEEIAALERTEAALSEAHASVLKLIRRYQNSKYNPTNADNWE